ncbi:MAG: AIPR family protein, partial [Armatimonadetes bacterium]|nr:AIPR family protein [Armatimonadota bacterium]
MTDQISYSQFRDNWIENALHDASNSTEKGRAFSLRIVRQWLNLGEEEEPDEEAAEDLFYCDGASDGGIDLAFLERGEASTEGEPEGDTWYLVQSKYGKAFQGEHTLVEEGRKIVDTLDGSRDKLSSLSNEVLERLRNFLKKRSDRDRLVLVFATVDPIDDKEKKALEDVRIIARERLGFNVEVESISLHTIFSRNREDGEMGDEGVICVALPLEVPQSEEGAELLVGTVTLPHVYQFLSDYKRARGDLEVLYARNVRVFLGGKGKVNKGIAGTLSEHPELFGFYNNGITIVVSDFHVREGGVLEVCDPAVVNGCQTTRSIWEVFEKKTKSGGTGKDRELADWMARVHQGNVVVKIVRVQVPDSNELLHNITRFTNSQNAVKDQDFLALESGFSLWQRELANERIYLEIQRGGSDAQKARQKNKTKTRFDYFVNAFDLFKVYGAGWLGEPGQAWNKNAAFLPKGEFFNEIVKPPFGAADLLECFHLQQGAAARHFGKRIKDEYLTRRLTRYLFFFVTLELLR